MASQVHAGPTVDLIGTIAGAPTNPTGHDLQTATMHRFATLAAPGKLGRTAGLPVQLDQPHGQIGEE